MTDLEGLVNFSPQHVIGAGIYFKAATDWAEVAERLSHAHELAAPTAKARKPARR